MIANLDQPSEVLPHLLVGSWETATNQEDLEAYGVTHILSLTDEGAPTPDSAIVHLHCPLSDHGLTDLQASLRICVEFIGSAAASGGIVLVHCVLGVNRSPTFCMAYLVKSEGWTLREAFEHLCRVRVYVAPHSLYVSQLQEVEIALHGTATLSAEEVDAYLHALVGSHQKP